MKKDITIKETGDTTAAMREAECFSRPTWNRWVKAGLVPKPIGYVLGRARYDLAEVRAAKVNLARAPAKVGTPRPLERQLHDAAVNCLTERGAWTLAQVLADFSTDGRLETIPEVKRDAALAALLSRLAEKRIASPSTAHL